MGRKSSGRFPSPAPLFVLSRLQDMEVQYRREKEEADLLLEQHRLVCFCLR